MLNNFSEILTLLLLGYVLYIIIYNGFGDKNKEGFEDAVDPPEYDPNDPEVFNKPYDKSKIIDGKYSDSINLRESIKYELENIKKEDSYTSRPYRLDKKSILKPTDVDNKYLKKEDSNLGNLNFLYPKSHSQTDFSGIHSKQKNVHLRADPPNPRSDQKPFTIKIIKNKNI
jgi:hypothetical protein